MAVAKLPQGAEWVITCELVDRDGTVCARPVPLRWAAAWAREAHTNTLGTTFKGYLDSAIQSAFSPASRRRR